MADPTITYETLPPEVRRDLVYTRLQSIEREHYNVRLDVDLLGTANGASQLQAVTDRLEKAQQMLADIDREIAGAKPPTAAQGA